MAPKKSRFGSVELNRGFSAASSSGAEANIMNFKVNAFGIYNENFLLAAPATVQDLVDAIFANPGSLVQRTSTASAASSL